MGNGMVNARMCPGCQHRFLSEGLECSCNTALIADAIIWKMSSIEDIEQPTLRPIEFKRNTLYLYVAGAPSQRPIQHPAQESIVLGRNSDPVSGCTQRVDLNQFHAQSLGVSRQHALIRWDSVEYTLEDLDSCNGTLLNGNPLLPGQTYPLHSGDHLQLGDMLILIYFV